MKIRSINMQKEFAYSSSSGSAYLKRGREWNTTDSYTVPKMPLLDRNKHYDYNNWASSRSEINQIMGHHLALKQNPTPDQFHFHQNLPHPLHFENIPSQPPLCENPPSQPPLCENPPPQPPVCQNQLDQSHSSNNILQPSGINVCKDMSFCDQTKISSNMSTLEKLKMVDELTNIIITTESEAAIATKIMDYINKSILHYRIQNLPSSIENVLTKKIVEGDFQKLKNIAELLSKGEGNSSNSMSNMQTSSVAPGVSSDMNLEKGPMPVSSTSKVSICDNRNVQASQSSSEQTGVPLEIQGNILTSENNKLSQLKETTIQSKVIVDALQNVNKIIAQNSTESDKNSAPNLQTPTGINNFNSQHESVTYSKATTPVVDLQKLWNLQQQNIPVCKSETLLPTSTTLTSTKGSNPMNWEKRVVMSSSTVYNKPNISSFDSENLHRGYLNSVRIEALSRAVNSLQGSNRNSSTSIALIDQLMGVSSSVHDKNSTIGQREYASNNAQTNKSDSLNLQPFVPASSALPFSYSNESYKHGAYRTQFSADTEYCKKEIIPGLTLMENNTSYLEPTLSNTKKLNIRTPHNAYY